MLQVLAFHPDTAVFGGTIMPGLTLSYRNTATEKFK